jgi:chromosomal replication initiator protein
MEGSALYNPRAHATPSQLLEAAKKRARTDRINGLAKPDSGIACLSASQRGAILPIVAPASPKPEAFPLQRQCSPVDPRLTFDTFIAGKSNALALAAARQMIDWDSISYNPLVIHSRSGTGKTHLLNAMCQDRAAVYMTAARFNAFVIGKDIDEAFAPAKIILIDDIHCLAGRASFAALNDLIDSGKRLVLTSDRAPIDMEIGDRLRTRLSGGLIVEIAGFGDDIKAEIVRTRANAASVDKPSFVLSEQCIQFIAEAISNGRQADGAINRLLAYHSLSGVDVTMDVIETELRGLFEEAEERKKIKIEDIKRVVARRYGVSFHDLSSARRTANIIRPRQLAMYLAKTLTLKSLPEVGRRFGNRDHTTVLHAVRKIEALIPKDASLSQELDEIKLEVRNR